MGKFLGALRLSLLGLLFPLSCFAIWSDEHIWMFKCSLVATEFGPWFVLPCLILALVRPGRLSLCLGLAAALLFSSSEIRSLPVRWGLPDRFLAAFGRPLQDPPPVAARAAQDPQEIEFDPQAHLWLSYFSAQRADPAPCLIVVHGGGWDGGDRHEFRRWNAWLAQEGIAVASIDYRLAPAARWPAQREDLLRARAFLAGHAKTLGIDPGRFAVLGRSAGAQIAVATAFQNPRLFQAVVDLYGPADLFFAWKYGRTDDILDSPKLLRQYTGGSPSGSAGVYADASPWLYASKDSPPTLMIHGSQDRLVWCRQSERLDEKLAQKKQGRHLLVLLPWAVHAFDFSFDGPGAAICRAGIWNFLDLNLVSGPKALR
jgi:acetyl esterase/lipase